MLLGLLDEELLKLGLAGFIEPVDAVTANADAGDATGADEELDELDALQP
ncbi:hypothetical protein AGMMS50222_10750 [Endomicrobiia bacterium]|nr:hypothetical protein AGMMS49531_10650 [Endomicrobiia bacterium]GHT64995.1 hypothetical protein AGMMS49556_04050 [Endomicrobiia bacterium]GHT69537.1 hypothetical protein AGMMS49950_02480 [Endomicrobiia bacterium]GHT77317.1 hypothetical protein AGMMS50222_10750 [Endomicrobiia bacterium]